MNKILFLLLSMTLGLLSSRVWSHSQVTVYLPNRDETVQINDAGSLAQLVTHPVLMNNVWWPTAVIATRPATEQALRDRQRVRQNLSAWEHKTDGELAATLRHINQQLQNLQVTGRQFVRLDPDVVRTQATANRRLAGEYRLYSSSRPDSVTLLGAVSRSGNVVWRPGTSVAEYLRDNNRLAGADLNHVVIISPDGRTELAPVAYWNRRHVEAEPGSILWVGFADQILPSAFRELNQQIVSLLARRVPE